MNMKAETGVMHLEAKEHQRLLASHQRLAEGNGTDPSLTTLRRNLRRGERERSATWVGSKGSRQSG